MKYAAVDGVVRWSGGTTVLSRGKTTADDDHALVIERPDLWTSDEPAAHLRGPATLAAEHAARQPNSDVVTASARPGGTRNVGPR